MNRVSECRPTLEYSSRCIDIIFKTKSSFIAFDVRAYEIHEGVGKILESIIMVMNNIIIMCRIWIMWNTRELNQSIIKKRTSKSKCCEQHRRVSLLLYNFALQIYSFHVPISYIRVRVDIIL